VRSLSFNIRRGLAALATIGALALSATACGSLGGSASSSDACGSGSGGGNVNTCFSISDLGSSKGDAVIPAGTSVTIVCKDNGSSVGIVIPKGIKNADMSGVEWKTKGGGSAARGIPSSYFNSVPSGLGSCDNVLKHA
jgi:hypothetical protein